jgi:hypothetical protein
MDLIAELDQSPGLLPSPMADELTDRAPKEIALAAIMGPCPLWNQACALGRSAEAPRPEQVLDHGQAQRSPVLAV